MWITCNQNLVWHVQFSTDPMGVLSICHEGQWINNVLKTTINRNLCSGYIVGHTFICWVIISHFYNIIQIDMSMWSALRQDIRIMDGMFFCHITPWHLSWRSWWHFLRQCKHLYLYNLHVCYSQPACHATLVLWYQTSSNWILICDEVVPKKGIKKGQSRCQCTRKAQIQTIHSRKYSISHLFHFLTTHIKILIVILCFLLQDNIQHHIKLMCVSMSRQV